MMTSNRIRTGGIWILIMGLVLMLGASSAMAWGKKQPKKDPPRKAVNLNQYPNMTFKRGILGKDVYGNWEVGATTLGFTRHSRVTDKEGSGSAPAMSTGKEAMVMGYQRGATFVVHRLTMLTTNESVRLGTFSTGTSDDELPELEPNTPE